MIEIAGYLLLYFLFVSSRPVLSSDVSSKMEPMLLAASVTHVMHSLSLRFSILSRLFSSWRLDTIFISLLKDFVAIMTALLADLQPVSFFAVSIAVISSSVRFLIMTHLCFSILCKGIDLCESVTKIFSLPRRYFSLSLLRNTLS